MSNTAKANIPRYSPTLKHIPKQFIATMLPYDESAQCDLVCDQFTSHSTEQPPKKHHSLFGIYMKYTLI